MTSGLIRPEQKTPKAAAAYIIREINRWADEYELGIHAVALEPSHGAPVIGLEEFGFESAIRFSLGEGLYGDDYSMCMGPGFDLESPHVYLEAENSWSVSVWPHWSPSEWPQD